MAIPTSFGPITPSANTTTVFPILGTTMYGIDIGGALTPAVVPLINGLTLYSDAVKTTAQIVEAMRDYLRRTGSDHVGGAGGYVVRGTNIILPTKTVCT